MDELEALNKLGIATSPAISDMTGKNMAATIRRLNSYIKYGMLQVIEADRGGIRRYYIKNEMYKIISREETEQE